MSEPISTITSPIYRDAARTINETSFEVYVKGGYMPIVHYAYLRNPNIRPINAPDDVESENFSLGRYTLVSIIDMLISGIEFQFRYFSDVEKAAGFLKAYIDQCNAFEVANNPDAKAFLERAKFAYETFRDRVQGKKDATTVKGGLKTARSIDQVVKFLAAQL